MLISIFAFSYLIHESNFFYEDFKEYSEEKKSFGLFKTIAFNLVKKVKQPIFPLVSADEVLGCCSVATDGTQCVTSSLENCADGADFSAFTQCESTNFCQKGCCYNENTGVYDENVLESSCNLDWTPDPNCNLPGANKGCCVLGNSVEFATFGQCTISSEQQGVGVDWRSDLNEASCTALPYLQEKGACVLNEGDCMFITNENCIGLGGDFNLNALCTSGSLDTICEPTGETTCVDGKYGVYFVDSCGNTANIYDSSKVNDPSYWNNVISEEDSCGANSQIGNANSKSCGNCNLFAGGICSSASADGFNPDYGNNYCREVSCEFDGEEYENGESWCVYDGAVGNGDDVVGSRHWKYICNQGRVDVEACEDYRNGICLQSNTEVDGEIVFRNANCAVNNWRQCVTLNSEEGGIEKCEDTIGCRIQRVEIGSQFSFDACTPKYPAGFDLRDDRPQGTSLMTCGLATQTCTVVRKPKFFGGCSYYKNQECLTEKFGEEMNNLCRKLGDCGGEVNIVGQFEKNYKIKKSPDLNSMYVDVLKSLSEPIPGQYAEVDEEYGDYLEAMGAINPNVDGDNSLINSLSATTLGIGGIAYAVETALIINTVGFGGLHMGLVTIPTASVSTTLSFAGAAIGAAIGFQVGLYIAGQLDLSPAGTLMMAIGGASAGAVLGLSLLGKAALFAGFGAVFFLGGIILMLLSLFFGGSDCDPIEVEFECKVWQPPKGGDDCEKCNGDPLKPCSKYRCQSLGATCEFIDYGTEEDSYDVCYDAGVNDVAPPVISPQLGTISSTETYSDITAQGFGITSSDGGCVEANNPLTFGISTDELAICRYSLEEKTYDEMDIDISHNLFLYNHTIQFMVPDLSHGQSQGTGWNGELNLYVKCQDPNGHETPNFYVINMCANQGVDNTPPRIMAANPSSNSIVNFDATEKEVRVITNELSTCRWSDVENTDYYSMTNQMVCNDIFGHPSSANGYKCSANFSVSSGTTTNYIRCADQPWYEGTENESMRNPNTQDTEYVLRKPDKKIEIDAVQPFNDMEIVTEFASIDLKVQTSGGGEFHQCFYSFLDYDNMVEFYETGITKTHVQPLQLPADEYEIFVWCRDETGDSAESSTSFEIIYDDSVPTISRIWNSLGKINLITDGPAECRYSRNSCSFSWSNGTLMSHIGNTHSLNSVSGQEYFVRCKDINGNAPNDCSVNFVAV